MHQLLRKTILFIAIALCYCNQKLIAQSVIDHIQPAVKKGGFVLDSSFLWCPSVIKVGKTYHLFASRWPARYGIAGWTTYSEVIRATSDNLFGPYRFQEVVLQKRAGYWDNDRVHNPKIIKAGDRFVLFYISAANETGYATADQISGSWKRSDSVAVAFSNPAPLVQADGSLYVFGRKAVKDIRIAQGAVAPSFKGPYTIIKGGENLLPGNNGLEDPTIWLADGGYYVVCSDFKGDVTGTPKNGVEYHSKDGISYTPVSTASVYTKTVLYDDGSSETFRRRERPFVYVENGKPLALFTACMPQDGAGRIVVNPIEMGK